MPGFDFNITSDDVISCPTRSVRGGEFNEPRHYSRVVASFSSPETVRTRSTGFRVVRNLAD